jgi:hypothetical protein
MVLPGDLYRLSGRKDSLRYLVLGVSNRETTDSTAIQEELALYAIDLGVSPPTVSPPYNLGTNSTNSVVLRGIADFDGDGLADVAYCRWPDSPGPEGGGPSQVGQLQVVGYRGGSWYVIKQPKVSFLSCGT